jgi:hypothetical protein
MTRIQKGKKGTPHEHLKRTTVKLAAKCTWRQAVRYCLHPQEELHSGHLQRTTIRSLNVLRLRISNTVPSPLEGSLYPCETSTSSKLLRNDPCLAPLQWHAPCADKLNCTRDEIDEQILVLQAAG